MLGTQVVPGKAENTGDLHAWSLQFYICPNLSSLEQKENWYNNDWYFWAWTKIQVICCIPYTYVLILQKKKKKYSCEV